MKKVSRERPFGSPMYLPEVDSHFVETIRLVHSEFGADTMPIFFYDKLLSYLLATSKSQCGFIGDILTTDAGEPYLKARAITDVSWSRKYVEFYEKRGLEGLDFLNLQNLIGAVITSARPVLANEPTCDPRRGGLPPGHPVIESFLGLPLCYEGKLIGMVGLANRAGGYDERLTNYLQPVLTTFSTIIHAYWNTRGRSKGETASGSLICEVDPHAG